LNVAVVLVVLGFLKPSHIIYKGVPGSKYHIFEKASFI